MIRDGKLIECTQKEAVRQWVGFLVKTTAERFAVYEGTEFGTYIENYIGYKDAALLHRKLKEEKLWKKRELNRAISEIAGFLHEKDGSRLRIHLTVIMREGEEVEVETVV